MTNRDDLESDIRKQSPHLCAQYRQALLEDVIPFWERHSVDPDGGFYTCLGRDGSVFDTDKFVWLQARQVWMFATLYSLVERRRPWLDTATHGAGFLRTHGMDRDGNWYFALTRRGRPLVQPYNIFSDCFAAMAFSRYAEAAGDDEAGELARRTFVNVLKRKSNPKGVYSKVVPDTRPMVGLALPMILANVCTEMSQILTAEEVERTVQDCIDEVFALFLDGQHGVLRENVCLDGTTADTFDGRLVNPGHGIEAMWFIMDIAERRGDKELVERATDVVLRTLEFGWDRELGGIYYFLDIDGKPPQQLEWDQKLWWVHLESLIALVMGYRLTGRAECWSWYRKVHDYAWARFADPEYGEWFGYLNRRGEVLLPLKGGKWKGCFHVPRAMLRCMLEFGKLSGAN